MKIDTTNRKNKGMKGDWNELWNNALQNCLKKTPYHGIM